MWVVFFSSSGDFETVQACFIDDLGIPKFKLNEGLRLAAERGSLCSKKEKKNMKLSY